MAIAPGNYFSPLLLYTNDATGHDIKPLASNLGASNKPSSTCSTEVRAVNREFILAKFCDFDNHYYIRTYAEELTNPVSPKRLLLNTRIYRRNRVSLRKSYI